MITGLDYFPSLNPKVIYLPIKVVNLINQLLLAMNIKLSVLIK